MEKLSLRICFLGLLLAGPAVAQPIFTEVKIDMPLPLSYGVACGDYDNDQWPDIFLGSYYGETPDPAVLLGNQGNGRFAGRNALIESDLVPYNGKSTGVIFGDYDNDNDLDLYVPRGWVRASARDRLLRNDQGRFTDVTLRAGLTDSLPSGNAIWLDYDRDGWLDLYVGHWLALGANQDAPDLYNSLYRNKGDGTFAEVTEAVGLKMNLSSGTVHRGGSYGGMASGDFNSDGWPDLYLGVIVAPNRLFLNDGQGHFLDATTKEIGDPGEAQGVAVGDIDNDGDLEIFQSAGGGVLGLQRSLLLLNVGEGQFLDVTEGVGLTALGAIETSGSGLADIDDDGDLDLVIATPTLVFLNQGDGTFIDATSGSGLGPIHSNLSFIDYDRDGFLDVISGRSSASTGPGGVFRNQGNNNHWLRVELAGTRSNRNGIGARLFATAGDLRQLREILTGNGKNQSEMGAHFGLGERTVVDRLEVRWPSGQVDVFTTIPADQQIRVIEGRADYHRVEPTRWQQAPPETLVAGATLHLSLGVQPSLFEPGAEVTSVTVDLSELGGPEVVPLQANSDGTYRLEPLSLPIEGPNGFRTLSVMINQQTSLGSYWTQLSRSVAVLPAEDLVVFGDALDGQWQVETRDKVEFDFAARTVVFNGQAALALKTPFFWQMQYLPAKPIDRLGYQALRFAFHPGDAAVPRDQSFAVLVNSEQITLLGRRQTLASARIDMEVKDWQIVEIPLDSLKAREPIVSLGFLGNLEGTFYLDDLRLVAIAPPPVTLVEEEHTASLPQSFSLSQNFPNPFNSETVIRFALPEGGEVELTVYNLAGQRVAKLVEGTREAGSYTVRWDGRDQQGHELASGVYLYRLQVGAQVKTHKLALVR